MNWRIDSSYPVRQSEKLSRANIAERLGYFARRDENRNVARETIYTTIETQLKLKSGSELYPLAEVLTLIAGLPRAAGIADNLKGICGLLPGEQTANETVPRTSVATALLKRPDSLEILTGITF
jgi:hypothetical protein